jgi:hypothetical protein
VRLVAIRAAAPRYRRTTWTLCAAAEHVVREAGAGCRECALAEVAHEAEWWRGEPLPHELGWDESMALGAAPDGGGQ